MRAAHCVGQAGRKAGHLMQQTYVQKARRGAHSLTITRKRKQTKTNTSRLAGRQTGFVCDCVLRAALGSRVRRHSDFVRECVLRIMARMEVGQADMQSFVDGSVKVPRFEAAF